MINPITTDVSSLRLMAAPIHNHARACKRSIVECKTCALGVEFFQSIPVHVLPLVLEDRGGSKRQGAV